MALSEFALENGEKVATSSLPPQLLQRAPLLNVGVFETLRSYSGKIFELEEHMDRLRDGLVFLGQDPAPATELTEDRLSELLRSNSLTDAHIRITAVLRSSGGGRSPKYDVLVTAGKLDLYPPDLYENGMKLTTSTLVRNELSEVSRHKTSSMLESFLAHQRAQAAGADTAILLNTKGMVAEAAWANIFMVVGSKVRTPRIEDGALPGITRKVLMQLATEEDIPVEAGPISCSELKAADEIFITNTLMEIMPVQMIDGRRVGGDIVEGAFAPGPVTQKLTVKYRNRTAVPGISGRLRKEEG